MSIQQINEIDGVLTIEEIGELLKISRTKSYELANSGEFPVRRIGRSLRVPKRSFYEWLNRN